jgi:enediyne biosynthesis protein E4
VIVDAIGSGVALLDYDNDGWLDIYLVNGSTVEALTGKATPPHAALFHNNHDGTFTEVAEKAGVTNDRWGFGAVVGDFDNDGWPDIYVSNYGKNRLYRNNHDGTFTDVAEKAGVGLGGWSTGATWGDYDGDGRLDLFVPGYIEMSLAELQQRESSPPSCNFRGVQVMCGPRGLKGQSDHLFHNNGDGTFTDVSVKAGVSDPSGYYGLASIFVDINGDGRPDLLVANDSTPNYLYVNKGNGTFEDDSYASGYALNASGSETATMGIAIGDYAHSGRLDVYNTTFSDDYNPLYRNDGNANFVDIAYQAGIAEPTIPFLGWGTAFFDYDNDGWLDLFVSNGHVYPQVDKQNFGTTWAQRPLLFHDVRGAFHLVPPVEGSGLSKLASARGMAYGDLFNDGRIDVVVNNMDASPSLFQNVTGTPAAIAKEPAGTHTPVPNHWIAFKLVGGPRSPRDAVGATIYLTSNGFCQRVDVLAGGSFASSSDQRPHFGLGTTTKIEALEIRWPDGTRQQLKPPGTVDAFYSVMEGKPAEPLKFRP